MSRQPKSNGCLRIWADEVTVAKIRAGNSIIRNPILVSYIAKGLLPYRGLGSGIKRALDDWPAIDFDDDRDGNLFTATVHRKEPPSSQIADPGSEKSSEKLLEMLKTNPGLTARELANVLGISQRAVEKQIYKLGKQTASGASARTRAATGK
jgi:ATP-dependent DNA helicase RecG